MYFNEQPTNMSTFENGEGSILEYFPPMGVYETLFKFREVTGQSMGADGTHPWAQGFPLATTIPGGPDMAVKMSLNYSDLTYGSSTGELPLLCAIRDYYKHFYGADISTDNIAVFSGGRPALYATLAFLKPEVSVLVEEAEYTPYWDVLHNLEKNYKIIPSNESNSFRPTLDTYKEAVDEGESVFLLKSNPCNPTGVTWKDDELKGFVNFCAESPATRGGLFDEAYEFFHDPAPVSALKYVKNIDDTNIFVVSSATKGLQAPGLRVGWVVTSKKNVELFRNFSSIAMGGISRPSQLCTASLLDIARVTQSRNAICKFYGNQRRRYQTALIELGFEIYTGEGGFYHWCKLPNGLTAELFNERLFAHKAGVLPGTLCDMFRREEESPFQHFIRFSFGPLTEESFDDDIEILKACIRPASCNTVACIV